MDVADAIDAEAVSVTLLARTAGGVPRGNGGKYVPGTRLSSTISAAIQPPSGRVLNDVMEGIRPQISYIVWTRSAIALDDQIVYGGDTFRVLHVWPRPLDGFNRAAIGNVTT